MSAASTKIIIKLWFGDLDKGPKYTIDDIFDFFRKDEQRDVRAAIAKLKHSQFISKKQSYDGSTLISLSEKGKLRALNIIFNRFDNRKEKWDGKWRMVSFDIPNLYVKGRKALAYRLKVGGFYKMQESLFLYPYDCEKEIRALSKLFKIEKYVTFGLLESIDNQDRLVHHFKL